MKTWLSQRPAVFGKGKAMMFCRLCFGAVLGIGLLSSTATAGSSRIRVTYSGPEVIFGPISGGLKQLPQEVCLMIVFAGTTDPRVVGLDDIGPASMEFGDGVWTELSSFAMTIGFDEEVTALSYQFCPIDTATTLNLEALNFPLTIRGTDIASGQDFEYVYSNSSQTLAECPLDCVGNDGITGIDEFLAILGLWGDGYVDEPCDFIADDGIIGIDELLSILGQTWGFGTCPPLPQCPQ